MTLQEIDSLCEGDLLAVIVPKSGNVYYYAVAMVHDSGVQVMCLNSDDMAANFNRPTEYVRFGEFSQSSWTLVSRATQGRPR